MDRETLVRLAEPFPRSLVSWRSQSLMKDGTKALALAYIDARDVMNRLDQVCGPENWQSSLEETPKGRIITTIRIRVGDDWIGKSDGAGATDVEGDKGAISDSLKRCAVQWGIGRYLYDLESPWVPCECSEFNGKKQWKKWTVDPWSCVRNAPQEPNHSSQARTVKAEPTADLINDDQRSIILGLANTAGMDLGTICKGYAIEDLRDLPAAKYAALDKRLRAMIADNLKKEAA